jgi:DNA-binding Lrp family transcriptional regulator
MHSTAVLKTDDDKASTFGWLQFEKKALQELQKLAVKSPSSMGVLLYLANNMSRSNALAVSQGAIAKKVGISVRTAASALKRLSDHNFIEIIKVGNMGVYRVNTRVAWQGHRGERFAHFTADIIALESEQDVDAMDNSAPLKSVPQLIEGERILVGNENLDPPDQGEFELP